MKYGYIYLIQQLTASGVSGVNGQNATRLAALGRKARCEHTQSLSSLVEKNVEETHKWQLRCDHYCSEDFLFGR